MPDLSNVTVLGAGVLGAQIAFQASAHGAAVTGYDIDAAAVDAARARLIAIVDRFVRDAGEDAREPAQGAVDRIHLTHDLPDAVAGAALVIEAVPENLELKRAVWAAVGASAPADAIFATNSSTLLPSAMADATGRPARFLALHFANQVWRHNTAEVMGHPGTDPAVFAAVVAFAEQIGMVPIPLHREQPGYVLNSLLVPFLDAGAGLLMNGVAEPETIDATWRIATGAPAGPFQIFDVVGLRTAYAISADAGDRGAAFARYLKENYLDHGKLGLESGEGFYRYGTAS